MQEAFPYDRVKFEVFCLEIYRKAKNLTGREVVDFFDRHDIFDFIERCGDVLHCQSEANTIADIDDFIASRKQAVATMRR